MYIQIYTIWLQSGQINTLPNYRQKCVIYVETKMIGLVLTSLTSTNEQYMV